MARTKKQRMSPGMSFSLALFAFICVAFGVFMIVKSPARAPSITVNNVNTNRTFSTGTTTNTTVPAESRTATFLSSVPVHGAILSSSSRNVTLSFSSPLGPASTVTVTDGTGAAVNLGRAKFSDDRGSMVVDLASGTDGIVKVTYSACVADNTGCETGTLAFTVAD